MPYSTASAPCGWWASFQDESPKQIRHLKAVNRLLLPSNGTDLPYPIFVLAFIGCFSLYYSVDFSISKIDTASAIFIAYENNAIFQEYSMTLNLFPKELYSFGK